MSQQKCLISIDLLIDLFSYQHHEVTFSLFRNVGRAVYIVAAKRTPIGSFNGKLSPFTATELGEFAVRGAIESINLNPKEIDEVILGNVLSSGLGQAPAKQVSVRAGIPVDVPCTTVNKVCASAMKAVMYGAQSIALGQSEMVVAGGFESMSRAPFLLMNVQLNLFSLEKDSAMEIKS